MSGNALGKGLQRRFKPYPAYKDSGLEWLGEIQEHWGCLTAIDRLKELRAAPISAAVTGKIDVREEVYPEVGEAGAGSSGRGRLKKPLVTGPSVI